MVVESTTGAFTAVGNGVAVLTMQGYSSFYPPPLNTATLGTFAVTLRSNLEPAVGDVDLGDPHPAWQFPLTSYTLKQIFNISVRVNVGRDTLGALALSLQLPATVTVLRIIPGDDWINGSFQALPDLAALTVLSSTPLTGLIKLATLVVQVSKLWLTADPASSIAASINGSINFLRNTRGQTIGSPTPRRLIAGAGWLVLPTKLNKRRQALALTPVFFNRGLPPYADCWPQRPLGDTNGDCLFDEADWIFALEAVTLNLQTGTYIPTLLVAQQQALDQDKNRVYDLQDVLILEKILQGITAFMSQTKLVKSTYPSCLFSFDVTLYARSGAPVPSELFNLIVQVDSTPYVNVVQLAVGSEMACLNCAPEILLSAMQRAPDQYTVLLIISLLLYCIL